VVRATLVHFSILFCFSSEWRQPWMACEIVERVAIEQALRWTARSIRELRASLATRGSNWSERARDREKVRGRERGSAFRNSKSNEKHSEPRERPRDTVRVFGCRGERRVTLCVSRNVRATRGSPVPSCFSWRLFCRSVSAIFFFLFHIEGKAYTLIYSLEEIFFEYRDVIRYYIRRQDIDLDF